MAGTVKAPETSKHPTAEKRGGGRSGSPTAEHAQELDGLLTLQRSAGNMAIQRLCRAPSIQPSLAISRPGDAYEQEADRVAENVMRMPMRSSPPRIQRMCSECEEEVQRKPKDGGGAGSEEQLMRATSSGDHFAAPSLAKRLQETRGRGTPLPRHTRDLMSNAMQADFSSVRVHTDSQASSMSERVRAKAFTYGSDIYFNTGQYNPNTPTGTRLLAHELTHVVQQGGGSRRIQRQVKSAGGSCTLEGATFEKKAVFNAKTPEQVTNGVPRKLYRPPAKPCTANRAKCNLDPPEIEYILEKDTPVLLGPLGGYGNLFQSICFTMEGKKTPEIYWVQKEYVSETSAESPAKPAEAATAAPALPSGPAPEFEAFRGDAVDQTGKISAPAQHYADAVATGMNVRSRPDPSAAVITKIKYNETVYVKAKNKAATASSTWVYVLALDGRAGWINAHFVATEMPEPNADLHHVTEPNLTTVLKNRYRGTEFNSPDDLRVLSAAVLVANKGREGLQVDLDKFKESLDENWFENLVDPWNTVNRAVFQSAKILAGHNIWLPSNGYIQQLKAEGLVTTRPAFVDAIIEFGKAYVGFQLGVLEGFFGSIWEALEGIWELGKTLIETVGKVITGEILQDLKGLYDSLKNLTWEQVEQIGSAILTSVGQWWEDIKTRWNSADTFEKARMIGRLVGAIALEVLLAIFTGGGANAVKWIGKLGKIAPRLMSVLRRAINAADKVVPDNLKPFRRSDKDLGDKDDSSKIDWYKALALAKAITETHDLKDTPVSLLKTHLAPLVTKFKPVTGYTATPIRPGHYRIIQTARKDDVVDSDYTAPAGAGTGGAVLTMPRITHALRGAVEAFDQGLLKKIMKRREELLGAEGDESWFRNIAAAKVRTKDGKIVTWIEANDPGGLHSEAKIFKRMEDEGATGIQIYSERIPCVEHACRPGSLSLFPDGVFFGIDPKVVKNFPKGETRNSTALKLLYGLR